MTIFYPIKIYSYPALIVSFLVLIPIFVTLKSLIKKRQIKPPPIKSYDIHVILLFFLFEILFYEILEFFVLSAPDPKTAIVLQRIFYMVIPFLMPTAAHLIFSFPDKILKKSIHVFLLFYFPALLLSALAATPLMIKDTYRADWGYAKILGPAYVFFYLDLLLVLALMISAAVRNALKYRAEPAIRNTALHLCLVTAGPALFNTLIAVILPVFFNIWKCHSLTPSYALGVQAIYMTYIIICRHLLDFDFLIGPMIKSERYFFHRELKKIIHEMHTADSLKNIITRLSTLLQCNVFLYINVRGEKYFISNGKSKSKIPFQDYPITESDIKSVDHDHDSENQRIAKFLSEYDAERFFPIITRNMTGLILFGRNFSKKIYSSKDIKLIHILCERLKEVILVLRDKKSSQNPLLILSRRGKVKGIVSDCHCEARLIDLETFSEKKVPALDDKAYHDFMEKIIDSHQLPNSVLSSPQDLNKGDIVLIHYDRKPIVYAKIEGRKSFDLDQRMFAVSLLFLVVPPITVEWHLTRDDLAGAPFVMEDHLLQIKRLEGESHGTLKVIPIRRI